MAIDEIISYSTRKRCLSGILVRAREKPGAFWPIATACVLYIGLMAAFLAKFGGDPSALVCASIKHVGEPPYEAVRVGFGPAGFDGQFYYAIARNPWQRQEHAADLAPYRHQRILLPVLAWLMSGGGDPWRLLWALPAINLAAVAGLTWLGTCLARRYGMSTWWGLTLPIAANAFMPALRDLTDPVSTVAVFGLVSAWLLRWNVWCLFLWGLAAVFSREQNVAVVLILFSAAGFTRQPKKAIGLAIVLSMWFAWFVTLRLLYGVWPLAGANFDPPLVGLYARLSQLGHLAANGSFPIRDLGIVLLPLEMLVALYLFPCSKSRVVATMLLAAVGLAMVGGYGIYEDVWNYARVFVWLPLGIWLSSIESQRRWPVAFMLPSLLWPVAAVIKG